MRYLQLRSLEDFGEEIARLANGNESMRDEPSAGISVERASLADRPAALELLYQQLPASERARQVAGSCDSANRGEFSLDELWIARQHGHLIAVLLQLFQPGKVAFVWLPMTAERTADYITERATSALLKAAGDSANSAGMQYSQIILEVDQHEALSRLEHQGYRRLTELLFQERPLIRKLAAAELGDLILEPFADEKSARMAQLLQRTFQGTRDCPEVSALISGWDALDRHLGTGSTATRHWVFARQWRAGELGDVGVLLLLDHQSGGTWEIDYFGIVPEARGRGLGKRLLQWGLWAAQARGASRIQAVVDSRNHYACTLYNESGFYVQQRRQALIRLRGSTEKTPG